MRFAAIVSSALAFVAPAVAVSLRCVPAQNPFCCVAAASIPEIPLSVGVECKQQPSGHVPKCPTDQVKVCCDKNAVDLLGLITLCVLPANISLPEVGDKLQEVGLETPVSRLLAAK